MKLYYFKDQNGNFGDDLNPWIFGILFPKLLDDNSEELLIGIGTLLNHRIPKARNVVVFGSGYGYGTPPVVSTNWTVYCVRGPGTAGVLALDENLAITDPAMLAPLYDNRHPDKIYRVSYMPHCVSAHMGDWEQVCRLAGVNMIDPRDNYMDVFLQIKQSHHLITEAMHGAILADAFRVPWTPAKAYPHISKFKWQDWLDSVKVNARFHDLPPVYRGDELLGVKDAMKNKTKRLLLGTSLWSRDWQPPPPVHSSRLVIEQCAEQLGMLAAREHGRLSADGLLASNTERLLTKAELLRKKYAT